MSTEALAEVDIASSRVDKRDVTAPPCDIYFIIPNKTIQKNKYNDFLGIVFISGSQYNYRITPSIFWKNI